MFNIFKQFSVFPTDMIIPETMAKVEVISLNRVRDRAVSTILKFSFFQPIEPQGDNLGEPMDEPRRLLSSVQDKLSKLELLIQESGLTMEPEGSMKAEDWLETAKVAISEAENLEEQYRSLLESISELKNEILVLKNKLEKLESFKGVSHGPRAFEEFKVYFGYADDYAVNELKKLDKVAVITGERKGEKVPVVLLADKSVDVERKLRELNVEVLELPSDSSPREEYERATKELEARVSLLEKERNELAGKLKQNEKAVRSTLGMLMTVRDALVLLSKARVSEHFTVFQGYVPLKFVEKLKGMLSFDGVFMTYAIPKYFEERAMGEEPPTYVSLPKSVRPLESVIEIYGIPSYWEISPTIFLIITFPFIFGLMFPDFGNALVLFLFSLWFRQYGKKKGSENIQRLSLVLIYSSIVAMITGLLEGEFMGQLPIGGLRELLQNEALPRGPLYPLWSSLGFQYAYNIMKPIIPSGGPEAVVNTIILSLLLGVILLFVSTLMGIINAAKKRDTEWLVYEKIPLFLMYTGPFLTFMYGFTDPANFTGQIASVLQGLLNFTILGKYDLSTPAYQFAFVVLILIYVGLFWYAAGKFIVERKHEGAGAGFAFAVAFVEGLFEPALMLLSNTISFIRVLVFALAHYYILFAFSYMAYLAAGSPSTLTAVFVNPAAIVILIIGNLLAIALEGLIVFIQDMRLHFYEMFSKFYEGKGKPFEPVKSYVTLE